MVSLTRLVFMAAAAVSLLAPARAAIAEQSLALLGSMPPTAFCMNTPNGIVNRPSVEAPPSPGPGMVPARESDRRIDAANNGPKPMQHLFPKEAVVSDYGPCSWPSKIAVPASQASADVRNRMDDCRTLLPSSSS